MRDLFNAAWEAGGDKPCICHSMECRYAPCTDAQDVTCCSDCMGCSNPCKAAKANERKARRNGKNN